MLYNYKNTCIDCIPIIGLRMGDPAIYVRKIYPACDSLLVRQIFENFPKVVELGLLEVLQQIIAVLQSTSCKQVVSNNIVSTF